MNRKYVFCREPFWFYDGPIEKNIFFSKKLDEFFFSKFSDLKIRKKISKKFSSSFFEKKYFFLLLNCFLLIFPDLTFPEICPKIVKNNYFHLKKSHFGPKGTWQIILRLTLEGSKRPENTWRVLHWDSSCREKFT